MASPNLHGRIQKNYTKTFPSNFSKETTFHQEFLKTNLPPLPPKSPTKTSSAKCFKCLGFGHIDANCQTKRTMMVEEINKDQIKMKQKKNMKKIMKITKRDSSPHQTW